MVQQEHEPVAWEIVFCGNARGISWGPERPKADQFFGGNVIEQFPLYRSPLMLTEEEKVAIYRAEDRLRTAHEPDDDVAATLRALLKRVGQRDV